MIGWLAASENAASVAAWGFVFTLVGFLATIIGLILTYRQAADAATAAKVASSEVDKFKVRLGRQDASRDISVVNTAMEETRRHLSTDSWESASQSYEIARRALIKLQLNDFLPEDHKKELKDLTGHIEKFCDAVDLHLAGGEDPPDKIVVMKYIRTSHLDLARLDALLVKDL